MCWTCLSSSVRKQLGGAWQLRSGRWQGYRERACLVVWGTQGSTLALPLRCCIIAGKLQTHLPSLFPHLCSGAKAVLPVTLSFVYVPYRTPSAGVHLDLYSPHHSPHFIEEQPEASNGEDTILSVRGWVWIWTRIQVTSKQVFVTLPPSAPAASCLVGVK